MKLNKNSQPAHKSLYRKLLCQGTLKKNQIKNNKNEEHEFNCATVKKFNLICDMVSGERDKSKYHS